MDYFIGQVLENSNIERLLPGTIIEIIESTDNVVVFKGSLFIKVSNCGETTAVQLKTGESSWRNPSFNCTYKILKLPG